MKASRFAFLLLPATILSLQSCLSDQEETDRNYSEWRKQNTAFFQDAEDEVLNGVKRYEKLTPKWDPASSVLLQWHKRGDANSITPLDNSTIDVKYLLTNIEGDTIDSSYANTTYGDSIFRCQPNEMITGFWIATTNMHVGDSVTAVIPYMAGYGITGSSTIPPYSTLIFQIKLDSIVSYDSLPWRP